MTCFLEIETHVDLGIPCGELLNRCLAAVMEAEDCPYETEVNVVVTDDEAIREVNWRFRQVDAATDVLSFPMLEFSAPSDFSCVEEAGADAYDPETGAVLLGDMMISAEHVLAQAAEYGHSVTREFSFLAVHSLLHLCGYDHMEEEDRILMEERQRFIMEKLGISREGEQPGQRE